MSGGGRAVAVLELNSSMLGELQGHFITYLEAAVITYVCLTHLNIILTTHDGGTMLARKNSTNSMESNMKEQLILESTITMSRVLYVLLHPVMQS